MCNPIAIVGGIGLGLMAVQTGVSMYNSSQEGQQRQDIARKNQTLAELAGQDATARGENAATLARAQASLNEGDMQAAYGASGVDGTVGSPMQALAAYRRKTDLDILTIRNNAAREAWGYKLQADAASQEGKLAALRAQNEMTGTLLGGTGRLLSQGVGLYSNSKSPLSTVQTG